MGICIYRNDEGFFSHSKCEFSFVYEANGNSFYVVFPIATEQYDNRQQGKQPKILKSLLLAKTIF
jgi:hypothetical protein